jgi:hypothetical protein
MRRKEFVDPYTKDQWEVIFKNTKAFTTIAKNAGVTFIRVREIYIRHFDPQNMELLSFKEFFEENKMMSCRMVSDVTGYTESDVRMFARLCGHRFISSKYNDDDYDYRKFFSENPGLTIKEAVEKTGKSLLSVRKNALYAKYRFKKVK